MCVCVYTDVKPLQRRRAKSLFIYLFIFPLFRACAAHTYATCAISSARQKNAVRRRTRDRMCPVQPGEENKQTDDFIVFPPPPSSPSSYLKSSRSRCRHFSFVSFSRSRHVGVSKERKDQTANENNTCCSGTRRFSVV